MTDKIKELKVLIEALDAESPLRKSLEDALNAELNRKATEDAQQASQEAKAQTDNENDEEEDGDAGKPSAILEEFTGKLEELLEDDEFIAASAGFLLGAVTVGAGALAVSAMKK